MADSQRKTANLFDGILDDGYYTNTDFDLVVTGGIFKSFKIYLVAGKYTIKWSIPVRAVREINNGIITQNPFDNRDTWVFQVNSDGYFGISFRNMTSTQWDNSVTIMLNSGNTALPYAPYWQHSLRKLTTATEAIENPLYSDGTAITSYTIKGNTVQNGTPTPSNPVEVNGVGELDSGQYKIPISSGQQTTNIYLGSTQTVRPIKKYVITGNETISHYDYDYQRFLLIIPTIPSMGTRLTPIICTHYIGIYDGRPIAQVPMNAVYTGSATDNSVLIKTDQTTDRSTFIAWLQEQYANGTPVTLWYAVSTPTTAAVNEPLMKIGTYADTLSNATAIPTTEGANSITVDTTVQPSEFTATWTGWHNASVKEYDGSDWQ